MKPFVRQILERAGWRPDRGQEYSAHEWEARLKSESFKLFPAAARALDLFGGVKVTQHAPGINLARDTFDLRPDLAFGEEDRFGRFEQILGLRLFPLGEGGAGHYFLAIAEDGRVFALMETIDLAGGSIEEAIENLITGRRGMALRADSDRPGT